MATTVSNTTGGIEIKLTVYSNCDDAQLFWRVKFGGSQDSPIDGCLGFQIERQRRQPDEQWSPTEILRNRVGFEDLPPPGDAGDPNERSKPCNIWPFQRYEWTDHGANNGETVRYRVSAVRLPAGGTAGQTVLEPIADTGWSGAIDINGSAGAETEAYFNRGFVMSQFVARIARENGWKARDIKDHIKELEEPLRRFLSGELRAALLRILDEAIQSPLLEIYAALYELSDAELISQLILLRERAHIILANGSDKSGDENSDARDKLNKAKVDVRDRLLASKGLGHNKFVVTVRKKDQLPLTAWTGSTNWSATGLCTQANNGLLIKRRDVAQDYLDQWHRLADAGNEFPADLVSANAESPRKAGEMDVWFTRVRNKSKKNTGVGSDIQALIDHVKSAKSMVLYVMFQPGLEPLLTILEQTGGIYTRGVVSTVTASNREKFSLNGVGEGSKEYRTALIQPDGIAKGFSAWVAEVTRAQFLTTKINPGVGHAITHSKMIVIDPFSDDCKVITGSHNFSASASEQNDENFIVSQGNKSLAEAYAVACLATYEHYAWRAYVKDQADKGKPIWSHLSTDPVWQQSYLTPRRKDHLSHWC